MTIGITVWQGRISPVFDVCREALILGIEDGCVVSRTQASIDTPNALFKIARLRELGVNTLICGAISEPLRQELTGQGLQVIAFVAGDIEEVTRAFIAGRLPAPSLSMPGCGRWGRHCRRARPDSNRCGIRRMR